mgnify:CR=1 FL=1
MSTPRKAGLSSAQAAKPPSTAAQPSTKAALEKTSLGLIDNWVRNIKDVYRFNKKELDNIKDEEQKLSRLIEINVMEQVKNIAKTTLVQKQWKDKKIPVIHGWIYDLKDGLIKELISIDHEDSFDEELYKYEFKTKF